MAQQNDENKPISKAHKLKWTAKKKEEYKTGAYNPNNSNDWRNMPLFSNVLDPENPHAAAIMALQKKEKPKNRAKTFKNSGNKAYLLGKDRYSDAITYYTQALDVKCKDSTMNATIYSNRAQIQLCLKNYGKVISDCDRSIALQPNTYKSYWRAATASRALSKYDRAIKYCHDGIVIMHKLIENEKQNPTLTKSDQQRNEDSDSSSEESSEDDTKKKKKKVVKTELEKLNGQFLKLKMLKETCVSQKLAVETEKKLKLQKEMELKMNVENEKNLVMDALKKREIVLGNEDKYNLNETYGRKYKIVYDAKMDKLVFPVLFIYPEYDESDFIKSFGESQHFMDHFTNMFAPNASGPGWDKRNKYVSHRLCVYYETKDRFVNVNVNKSLRDIVERKDYVIHVLPVFFVLSKDSEFRQKFVKRKSDAILK